VSRRDTAHVSLGRVAAANDKVEELVIVVVFYCLFLLCLPLFHSR
jgi:hypothetical protein